MLITARFLAAASEKQQVRRSVATPPPVLFASGRLWRACSSEELGARAKLYSPHRSQHQPASIQLIAQRQRRRQPRRNLTSPAIDTERVRVKHPIRGGRCPRPPPRPRPSPRPIAVDVEKNLSNAVDEEIEMEARGGGAATGARLGDAPQEHRREGGACACQPGPARERSKLSFRSFCECSSCRVHSRQVVSARGR